MTMDIIKVLDIFPGPTNNKRDTADWNGHQGLMLSVRHHGKFDGYQVTMVYGRQVSRFPVSKLEAARPDTVYLMLEKEAAKIMAPPKVRELFVEFHEPIVDDRPGETWEEVMSDV